MVSEPKAMSKILHFFASIIGFAVFAFIFYLVFRPDKRMMIGIGAVVAGIVLIVVFVGLIGRIREKLEEKRRTKPYKDRTVE